MESNKNEICLDYASSPSLAELFVNKQVGETCKITLEFLIKEKDDQKVSGVLKAVEGYGKESEELEEDEVEIDPESPVMVVLGKQPDNY